MNKHTTPWTTLRRVIDAAHYFAKGAGQHAGHTGGLW